MLSKSGPEQEVWKHTQHVILLMKFNCVLKNIKEFKTLLLIFNIIIFFNFHIPQKNYVVLYSISTVKLKV